MTDAAATTRFRLSDRVQFLPGVGPRRARALAKLGVETIGDLLHHFPVRHERQEARTIENLDEGMTATIVGMVTGVRTVHGSSRAGVSATVTDNTGRCSLFWFNAPYVAEQLRPGMIVRLTGKVTEYRQAPQLVNPRFEVLDEDAEPVDESAPPRFEPVYPATLDLPSRAIARLITPHLDDLVAQVHETHDREFLRSRQLPGLRWAVRAMHRPADDGGAAKARRRLAYDELLLMQLAVALARRGTRQETSVPLACTEEIDRRIRRRFPFALTPSQDRAVSAIIDDLSRDRPMNRLLQGDVGCGKTVVALYAVLVAVANKCQAAIMAPTELLAEQHERSIRQYLAGSRVRHCLLTGSLGAKARRQTVAQIANGDMHIVIGTHALVSGDVRFAKLGLVVIDEQHRFGVRQRATIRGKGPSPHYLVMTATPIPRTLAMTVFGDLDVTTIDELPPGRPPITTRVVDPRFHTGAFDFVRRRLEAGEQAYVVYPLVEESDHAAVRAATTEFRRLAGQVFAGFRVGLLHGRLDAAKREAAMADFAAGRTQVLVATTVIEVGIDVPNATCMVIEHAERYGLSQLHQLRGRIGRGQRSGHCFLLSDSDLAAGHERLSVLAGTTDGFRIAEQDLRLRGPGEMLGTRQHGLPELRVANLIDDADLLRMAQRDADAMIRADPRLRRPEHAGIRAMILERYKSVLGLSDVG